jgi:hypothetical protein
VASRHVSIIPLPGEQASGSGLQPPRYRLEGRTACA